MKRNFIIIILLLLSSLLWTRAAHTQELPCGAVLIGMSGFSSNKIDNSLVSKGSLSKFKDCPRDSRQCKRSCFKWTPQNTDEDTFCFATVQNFIYDATIALENHPAFKIRYKFPYKPSETDDFFWLESNQDLANELHKISIKGNSEKFTFGINRIGEVNTEVPGFLNCNNLKEIVDVQLEENSISYLPPRK